MSNFLEYKLSSKAIELEDLQGYSFAPKLDSKIDGFELFTAEVEFLEKVCKTVVSTGVSVNISGLYEEEDDDLMHPWKEKGVIKLKKELWQLSQCQIKEEVYTGGEIKFEFAGNIEKYIPAIGESIGHLFIVPVWCGKVVGVGKFSNEKVFAKRKGKDERV